ncbi:MAG: hypothetical protein HYX28_02520 [Candidatus Koribacter versatilis]|uniref:Uncharacterized protein n=1 Tax=Candidatus Korobacter versatilis TaxID=658062 RepID=A0A932EQ71_9BACT|nr:hypothetical protein [Candidatus Koribacter versatilis]
MPSSRETANRMLAAAALSPRCQHIRYNNHRCGAPARRDSNWCVFHAVDYEAFVPASGVPEDAASVQIEIARVIRGLQNGAMEPRAAGLILYGLQLASQNLRRLGEEMPSLENDAFPDHPYDLAWHIYLRLNAPPDRQDHARELCHQLAKFVRGETPYNPAATEKKAPTPA